MLKHGIGLVAPFLSSGFTNRLELDRKEEIRYVCLSDEEPINEIKETLMSGQKDINE